MNICVAGRTVELTGRQALYQRRLPAADHENMLINNGFIINIRISNRQIHDAEINFLIHDCVFQSRGRAFLQNNLNQWMALHEAWKKLWQQHVGSPKSHANCDFGAALVFDLTDFVSKSLLLLGNMLDIIVKADSGVC